MTWCRLLDGRLAFAERGMAGAGRDGKLSFHTTDFRLQDGTLISGINELDGEKRAACRRAARGRVVGGEGWVPGSDLRS